MYLENAYNIADLSKRIGGIAEAMDRKEREFHRIVDERLKKASEQKTSLAEFIE